MVKIPLLPDDFPRGVTGALSGAQPKLAARAADGEYVAGWTEQELLGRHEYCEDLVQQLVAYCMRKAKENPDWSHEFNFDRMARGLVQKVQAGKWDVTPDEQAWMTGRIRSLLGW